jgi:protein-disulfide isomerase
MKSVLTRRILIWLGGIAVIVGVGWGAMWLAKDIPVPNATGVLAVPVSPADHILGPADAPITLVEYSDYQCPACGAFYPIVKRLLAEPDLQGKVRFVYRNFPLTRLHPHAQLAAQAVEAAGFQGKFWEYHDALFEHQGTWSGMSDAGARGQFSAYAAELGLDAARFASDIDSPAVARRIQTDVDGALASGVNGTPTFYINGTVMPSPQSYDQFKQYVIQGIQ